MRVIAIMGTPGSGKSTIAKMLKGRIKNSVLIEVNKVVKEEKLYSGKDKHGTLVVKMDALSKELNALVKKCGSKGATVIIEGHLLSDIKIKGAIAIVLRAHLKTILARLERRRYSIEKIRENLVAEALDYSGVNAKMNYAKVFEVLAKTKAEAVKDVESIIKKGGKQNQVQLAYELYDIINKNKELGL